MVKTMKTEKFFDQVQQRAGLTSTEELRRVVEGALETLGERLEKTEREKLAAQVPDPLKEFLLKRHTERYSLEEFYNRVSARADVGYPEAVTGARAVMTVLKDAVSGGEIKHILSQLPDEYEELFGAAPEGPLSPTKV